MPSTTTTTANSETSGNQSSKIHAQNSSEECKKVNPNDAGYLENELLLSHGFRVMLTHNLDVTDGEGLLNGTMGTVQHIKWNEGVRDPFQTPPAMILVEFDHYKGRLGCNYNGHWLVPIEPRTHQIELEDMTGQRTQFPLILAYAMTVHKSQGLTLSK